MATGPHRVAVQTACEEDENKENVTIDPRGFNITWGNDDRYWHFEGEGKSCVAVLKQVSWLEVTCSTDKVKNEKTYKVGFTVSLTPDAFGWDDVDVYVMAKIGKSGKFSCKKVSLKDKAPNTDVFIPYDNDPLKITAKSGNKIYVGLYEVWSNKWKGGLKIRNAIIQHTPTPAPDNSDQIESSSRQAQPP